MTEARRWERVDSKVVGEYGVFDVVRQRSRSPRDGRIHEFHVLDIDPGVIVIPLTSDGRVVMVEQFRHAVQRNTLEFPAGFLDEGEDPVTGALRELQEETGYCGGAAELVGEFDEDPAKQTTPAYVVVARECTADGDRDQDPGEDVHVRVFGVDEVDEMIRTGSIRVAAAITAWALFRRSVAD
jgi:ADP-ribose pyrophosphatase